MSNTNWDTPGEPPQLHAGALLVRLQWALAKLVEWGVRVPPRSRARNAVRLLEQLHQANLRGEPAPVQIDAETFAAHHHTATELFLIVYAAANSDYPGHPFTKERFNAVVLGSDVEERNKTYPRDREFELTVATRMRFGGIRVFDGEPDLQLEMGSQRWGVAVKRVTSRKGKQLSERLKSAVRQIERERMPGLIAIKLEGRLEGVTVGADDPEWFAQADAALDEVLRYSQKYIHSPWVCGIILFSDYTRPTAGLNSNRRPILDTSGAWRFSRFYYPWDDQEAGEAFWSAWQLSVQRNTDHCLTDR